MARGKYLSLEEARKSGKLDQFAKEYPIDDVHPQAHPEALHDAAFCGEPGDSRDGAEHQQQDQPRRVYGCFLRSMSACGKLQ